MVFAKVTAPGLLCLGLAFNASEASAECSANTKETLQIFDQWKSHMETELGSVSALSAMQDLATEAERMARALERSNASQNLHKRYSEILRDIAQTQGTQASARASEAIVRQIRWAARSLGDLSTCLSYVPLEVRSIKSITLAGAATAMSNVDPALFDSIGTIDRAMREKTPLIHDEGQTLFASLRHVNLSLDLAGGEFRSCERRYGSATTSGFRFRFPATRLGSNDWISVSVEPSAAIRTLAELETLCDS